MESVQAIQKRIDSIAVTRQISQAMRLVSNSKIRRAMDQMERSRPFVAEARQAALAAAAAAWEEPSDYLGQRPLKKRLLIVLGSDRGLCGGYNVNVGKLGLAAAREDACLVWAVGAKMREFFPRRGIAVGRSFTGISQNPFFADAMEIGREALALYHAGEVQQVVLVYTHFASVLSHIPTRQVLLPLAQPEEGDLAQGRPALLEPGEEALLEELVPLYLFAALYGALCEGAACEQSARLSSMDAAVRNSGEIIDKLTREYNRARQEGITQDISEIVSGAEAQNR